MLPSTEIMLRLAVAALLGSLIGFERERLVWAAGLRTHMLVSVGSALIMIVSSFGFSDILNYENVSLDPSRVAAQVVSGIGFLGAGTILLRRDVIRGLTTAASLWTVAGIGLAVGGGLYFAAISATILILLILAGVKPFERRFLHKRQPRSLTVVMDHGALPLKVLEEMLANGAISLRHVRVHPNNDTDTDEIEFSISRVPASTILEIVEPIRSVAGVRKITLSDD